MRLDKTDANKILGQLLSSGAAAGIAGGLVGGLLASKRGRMLGKKAVEIGGLAAVAGLAWMAWDRYRGGTSGARAGVVAPADSLGRATLAGFLPPVSEPGRANELSLTLVRAKTPEEGAWLAMLAARLGLPEPFVAQLDGRAKSETESVRATA